ncbi:HNH endonuclease [Acinetobacter sp. TGL-Y2]|uniref:HNH endonuclease n=1 Tax=Acinetobacter sp. TGL-Y2 TaxID=1407071 RepID=UPI0007A662D1|nr:HNH endonuclease [Acinetobacter sp. TGL-Y2]AMW78899.1 HNH endonuclease [Acinetobacter sp. TGL-Y2]
MLKNYQDLTPGDVLLNQDLCDYFGCSPQGGMRRSKRTNTLIIVSNHVESIYEDKWIGDILHYTGMGRLGDQKLNTQNKTLAESKTNGITVHLFEVFKDKNYIYQGPVELIDEPYQQQQEDEQKKSRTVWVFPLQLKSKNSAVTLTEIIETSKNKQRKLRKKTLEQLAAEAQATAKNDVGFRNTSTKYYIRSDSIVQLAKKLANGICQLCEEAAPFLDKNGDPYLETHHIEWLANGGSDSPENTVALCPNCHKKMHVVNDEKDKLFLRMKNLELKKLLITQ